MSANVVNQVAYLRTSRDFPEDSKKLTMEVAKAYIDTSNAVNVRTIGIFPVNRSAINGENWFLTGNQRQQGLRQVYTFTTTADINIGFKISKISQFTRFFGIYTDGTSWYGLIPGTSVAIAGQILFYVTVNGASTTSDVIKFVVGAGAPALTSGKIVLEWISDK
jgi:hypothetical protein